MLMCFGIEWKRRKIYDKNEKKRKLNHIKWVCVDNSTRSSFESCY